MMKEDFNLFLESIVGVMNSNGHKKVSVDDLYLCLFYGTKKMEEMIFKDENHLCTKSKLQDLCQCDKNTF